MTNMQLGTNLVQELLNSGVEEFILCAGARNSPLVHILDENKNLRIYSFFEERSAAFFALGRIALTRKPVAVITTSGTAVAELLPAAVEATYSSLPLILVTADRPKVYRGTGAPQSIEQVGIFSSYAESSFDLDFSDLNFSLKNWTSKSPLHVNICFEEPLLDGPVEKLIIPSLTLEKKTSPFVHDKNIESLESFLEQSRPLVLLGSLPDADGVVVLDFLRRLKAPIYAESISGLRGNPDLADFLIQSGEPMIEHLLKAGVCNSVLRLGGVPTARIWRDLETKHKGVQVYSVGFNQFSGLSRPIQHFSSLSILGQIKINSNKEPDIKTLELDKEQAKKIKNLLEIHPTSEQGMVYSLSKLMSGDRVYLGNSMPIREWDLCADQTALPQSLLANRGANGIDGQISTFLGWAHIDFENWCLIGDLTAMYDLSSLWVSPQMNAKNLKIVVINNGGGQIFSRMFNKDIFINKHNISFEFWAKMWNWPYQCWTSIPEGINLETQQIIEVRPDPIQTKLFWAELEKLWSL